MMEPQKEDKESLHIYGKELKAFQPIEDTKTVLGLKTDIMMLTNGIIRHGLRDPIFLTPYWLKNRFMPRFVLYAMFELRAKGHKPYVQLLGDYVIDNADRFVEMMYHKIKVDEPEMKRRKMTPEQMKQKVIENSRKIFRHDIEHALYKCEKVFFNFRRRRLRTSRFFARFMVLNVYGRELEKYFKDGYVF